MSDASPAPATADASPSKELLLEAARAVHRRGALVTVAAVAREAGVPRASVYRHFRSRDALRGAISEEGAPVGDARELLLDGCDRVLRELGPGGLTLAAVAASAGVGEATLYRHFGDRDGLLATWAKERSPRRLAAELAQLDGHDLAADLERLAAAGIEFVAGHPGLASQLMGHSDGSDLAALRAGPDSARAGLRVYLLRQESAGRLPAGTAERLARMLWGSVLTFGLMPPDAGSPAEHAGFLVGVLLRGLGGGSGPKLPELG